MFILPVCGLVTDSVTLLPVGDVTKLAPDMDKTRKLIKQLSNTEYLIGQIQKGEVLMSHKIAFDNYLKSHVDLMRAYVINNVPCEFSYGGYFTTSPISSQGLTIGEQWALEILMSRLNLCSIYHAGAYSSLEKIFINTTASFESGYKQASEFSNNLQITFRYFREGFEPLKRIGEVLSSVEKLLTSDKSRQILELRKDLFEAYRDMIECNLAYLKLEKYRILNEYRSCKEGAMAVYNRLLDVERRLSKYESQNLNKEFLVYVRLGKIFFKVYSLYYMLLEHEHAKVNEDYGFVKKEFQTMIMDNLVAISELERLQKVMASFPNKDSLDNAIFAEKVIGTIMQDVAKLKHRFSINLHENKDTMPGVDDVIARRIGLRNIWESLQQF